MEKNEVSGKSDLEKRLLLLQIKEQRFWFVKALAPYIAVVVTALGLMWTYLHDRDASRQEHGLQMSRIDQERNAEAEQAQHFIAQLAENQREANNTYQQSERHHREELFNEAIAQLGSQNPMQRVAAISALKQFSIDTEFRDGATSSLASLLAEETDPSTDEALYRAFDSATKSDVQALVRANVEARALLARSFGRYVGIEMGKEFPGTLEQPPGSDSTNISEYEREMIIREPVIAVYYHRRPLEEILSLDFIRDAFWLQSFPDSHREIFNSERNAAWEHPPKDYLTARNDALSKIQQATRYLEFTSSILERLLRLHSGHVTGWNLRGVYLVVADLRHLDLRGIDISGASLEMADIRKANLSDANCQKTDFDGANFAGASFMRTRLEGADLLQTQPFPIETPRGYTHTYTAPGASEELRFANADFSGSTWKKAASISPALKRYLATH